MPEIPQLPKLTPLQSDEIPVLRAELDRTFSTLLIYLERLRKVLPLNVSVNSTAVASVLDINIVAGSGIVLVPSYNVQNSVLTLTIHT